MKTINFIKRQNESVLWISLVVLFASTIATLYFCGAISE